MRDAMMRLLLILPLATAGGCTEAPDVVAVALDGLAGDGGTSDQAQSGGDDLPPLQDTELFADAGIDGCDTEQALMDARIPVETLVVALTCEVPLGAVQPADGEAAPQQVVAQLLNSGSRLDEQSAPADAQRCEDQPGGWWIDGRTVRLCPEFCQFVGDFVADLVQASCDAAAEGA